MLGAIIGDVVGSVYEFNNIKTKDFPFFSDGSEYTDDSVMTLAVCEILQKRVHDNPEEIVKIMKKWGRNYPDAGYGGHFYSWIFSGNDKPYNSCGNGSAMRVSACGWYGCSEEEVKHMAKCVTKVTHNHPEGLKGAEVTAMCVYYARIGKDKEFIKKYVENYYNLDFDYELLRKSYYHGDEICQVTVPQAIYCFLISDSFEDCIRTTISIGGDCDTTAAISGAIAEAYYKDIDLEIIRELYGKLPVKKEGTDAEDVLNKFLEYKYSINAGCEEINDKTEFVCKITGCGNKQKAEWKYSKSIRALTEDIVYCDIADMLRENAEVQDFNNVAFINAIMSQDNAKIMENLNINKVIKDVLTGMTASVINGNYGLEDEKLIMANRIFFVNNLYKALGRDTQYFYLDNYNEAIKFAKEKTNIDDKVGEIFDDTYWVEKPVTKYEDKPELRIVFLNEDKSTVDGYLYLYKGIYYLCDFKYEKPYKIHIEGMGIYAGDYLAAQDLPVPYWGFVNPPEDKDREDAKKYEDAIIEYAEKNYSL